MIYLKLFLSFLKVGLFSIGGGYAAVPLIQSQAVKANGWLSLSEFTDLISIAEMTPGPITVNSATFIGIKVAGLPGAAAATAGCVLPSLFIVTAMFLIYARFGKLKASQTVLSHIRPAVVALIASAGITILISVLSGKEAFFTLGTGINLAAALLFAASFIVLRKFKTNPIIVMASSGVIYLLLSLAFGA